MKKLVILLYFTLQLVVTGCKDFLDEDLSGQVLGDTAIETQAGLESALTGAYQGIGTRQTGFLWNLAIPITMGGDDVTTLSGGNKADLKEFDTFTVSAGNARGIRLYNGLYKTIQGSNLIINNYTKTIGVPSTINIIAGEAYFLRALSYYWLVRMYGSIPLLKSSEFSLELLTIGKTEPAEVYELIEADLLMAEQLLINTKRDFGRPNIGSAKALLADVYLTQGGWPIKDQSKYALAAAKAKQVIENHATYGFQLAPTFAEIFENDPAKAPSKEHVFAFAANMADSWTRNATIGWAAMPGDIGGWDDYFAEINFFNEFPEGVRKDKTFALTYTKANGTVLTWQQLTTGHPYYLKFWIKDAAQTQFTSLPVSMIRYAHVLTIYAEAKARSEGPDALAYACINNIRVRAGLTPLSDLSAEEFATAVVNERAWEFAGEKTRWFDLVRHEMVEDVNSRRNIAENVQKLPVTKNDYIFPLPISETLTNPNLE